MIALAAVLLSAAAWTLALPPWNAWLLGWVALVPLVVAVHSRRPGRAALLGGAWAVAQNLTTAYWVPPAMAYYYQQPLWFALLFAVVSSVLFRGIAGAAFGASVAWFAPRAPLGRRVLFTTAAWVAIELLRARWVTHDPWLLAGYVLLPDDTLIQAADLGGVYLLSAAVVAVNAVLAELAMVLAGRRGGEAARGLRPALAAAAVAVAGLAAYGRWRLAEPELEAPRVPIVVVQGNNDVAAQWRPELYGSGLRQYLDMSERAVAGAHPELIIWPESAVTFFLAYEPEYQAEIARLLVRSGADLIVGAPHFEGDPSVPSFYNSAFYLRADGRLAGRYDKRHLLPFAEQFPLRFSALMHRTFGPIRSFTPGEGSAVLETRIGPVAVVICFEAVFPDQVRAQMAQGAVALVNLSNDAWLGRGAGPAQHLAMVRLRAIENRTWVVRATTTGYSAIIDPQGRVRSHTPAFEPAVIDAAIAPRGGRTLYERAGDWFAIGCLLVAAGLGARAAAGQLSAARRRAAPVRPARPARSAAG